MSAAADDVCGTQRCPFDSDTDSDPDADKP
jgi:hypothetical protein